MKTSKNMKIGIDISQIAFAGTGVARFTKGLVEGTCEYDQNNQWFFFFSSLRLSMPEDIEHKILKKGHALKKIKIPPSMLSVMWNKFHIFNLGRFVGNLDWFISSDWTEPPGGTIKKAAIVHDLVYLRYPETVHKQILSNQKIRLEHIKRESKIIFADSQATKKDLVDLLHIDKKKIVVNYPGIDVRETRKLPSRKKFILTVGKLEPRKNLDRLIKAFSRLDDKSVELVIAGQPGWGKSLPHINNVKFLGYVDDKKLSDLYSSCLFFVYPSIWEGFGYPVIEAMSSGAAVATSNTSSLKEVAGDAALLFDPFNIENMRLKMQKLIDDANLRRSLIIKGNIRSKLFTWKKYINKLTQSFNDYRS